MKRLKSIFRLSSVVVLVTLSVLSCSEKGDDSQEFNPVELRQVQASVRPDLEIGLGSTKAGVALLSDPTLTSILNRGGFGWKLDTKLYIGANPYAPGTATFNYNTATSWMPSATVYFPNYTTTTGDFKLYPTSPTAPVETDQSTADKLLNQDILSTTGASVVPAHIISVSLKHAQSLLDFTFDRLPQGAVTVTVTCAGSTYTPYNVPGTTQYLLILPSLTTVTNPTVVVTTALGAIYQQQVKIIGSVSPGVPSALAVNARYIFRLLGLELGLSPVSVVDWVSGGMLAGDYVGVTAYPTFRGPANTTCTLTFDTGLTQDLAFNSQGECTLKPLGRTITQVTVGANSCVASQLLDAMIIDLNALISQCVPIP